MSNSGDDSGSHDEVVIEEKKVTLRDSALGRI